MLKLIDLPKIKKQNKQTIIKNTSTIFEVTFVCSAVIVSLQIFKCL